MYHVHTFSYSCQTISKVCILNIKMKNQNATISFLLGVFFIFAGFFGFLFNIQQKALQQSQDLRSQASENDLVTWPDLKLRESKTLYVNQETKIYFDLENNGYSPEEIFTTFNIVGKTLYAPFISSSVQSFYETKNVLMEETTDGYLVKVYLVRKTGQQLGVANSKEVFHVVFSPKNVGLFTFSFDEENTYFIKDGYRYPITAKRVDFNVISENTSNVKSCNESCTSNNECPVNHSCYDTGSGKKCRLATNVSSTTCAGITDNGLNRTCNEYCADSRECKSGYTCWYNSCRNPENVESQSCADLSTVQKETVIKSCNESCTANADCAVNMRCYNNTCRLASNPSSTSCSAMTEKAVSETYEKPNKQATEAANLPSKTDEPKASVAPSASPTPAPNVTNNSDSSGWNYSVEDILPITIIGVGILLLLASLFFFLMGKRQNQG